MTSRTTLFGAVGGAFALVSCANPATAPSEEKVNAGPQYDVILPGSEALSPDRLETGRIRYVKTGGKMTIDVERGQRDDQPIYAADVWFNADPGDGRPDAITFSAESLALVSRNFGNPEVYVIDVAVSADGHFTGALTPGENSDYSPRVYDKQHPHSAFEPSVLFLYMPALPLDDSFKASLPTFDLNDGSQIIWANMEAVGREMVSVGGERVEALKVVSDGVRKKTFWMAEGYAYPVKMTTQGAPGAWTLVVD